MTWGVCVNDLHGLELDPLRGAIGQEAMAGAADLRFGDAVDLPWKGGTFKLVILSTVFSSILDSQVCGLIAAQVDRVLTSDGAVLWYDLAVNHPKNSDVRGIGRKETPRYFPKYKCISRSVTSAPPVVRAVAPLSFASAVLLGLLPFLRTHNLSVLLKQQVRLS